MSDYQKDFYSWTREQAELLRSGRFNELDIVNLIEEIETMGRSEKRELKTDYCITGLSFKMAISACPAWPKLAIDHSGTAY